MAGASVDVDVDVDPQTQQTKQFDQLKDIVCKTLEKKGILAKTQAKLRKHVFEALLIGEQENKSNFCNLSPQIDENDIYDKFAMSLIGDFLSYHHLDYTLSLMNTESQNKLQLTQNITANEIASRLGLGAQKPNPDRCLLKQLVSKLFDSDVFKPTNSVLSNGIKLKQKSLLNTSYTSYQTALNNNINNNDRNERNNENENDNEYEDDFATDNESQNTLKLENVADIILNVKTDKIKFNFNCNHSDKTIKQ